MISYSNLGHARSGRLGNSLFQIASTIGIARANNTGYEFPAWEYEKYLANPLPRISGRYTEYRESGYHYKPIRINGNGNVSGWLQSSKYWADSAEEVRRVLTFAQGVFRPIIPEDKSDLPTIAISIRRGDFVGNPNYYQLPITFYILALQEHFPDFRDCNIIFFSDDLGYCRVNFECLPNAYFPDGYSDVEQLALMASCDHFIISNSTFSWWGAYLGQKSGSIVIRPKKNLAGKLARENSEADYWEPEWIVFDHEDKKIDLREFTFTIPVFYDHEDRKQNVNLCLAFLREHFHTNIMIGEQGGSVFVYTAKYARYLQFRGMNVFHRTKMLNEMAMRCKTDYIVNYDADIITPPMQMVEALHQLKSGADFVYPYDGRFARVIRRMWIDKLTRHLDIGIVGDHEFKGKHGNPLPISSVGGAVIVNKNSFLESGMENEYMISYTPEDCERWDRWHALGYNVKRIRGCVYHMDHYIGVNSSSRNPYFKQGHDLLDRIRAMHPDQLRAFVNTWPWKVQK